VLVLIPDDVRATQLEADAPDGDGIFLAGSASSSISLVSHVSGFCPMRPARMARSVRCPAGGAETAEQAGFDPRPLAEILIREAGQHLQKLWRS
jgi:hypothetical protein